jgi:hypothetical protein
MPLPDRREPARREIEKCHLSHNPIWSACLERSGLDHFSRRSTRNPKRRVNDPMAKKNGTITKARARRYRDALTGRFVTKKYAKKNRKTTLKEVTTRI